MAVGSLLVITKAVLLYNSWSPMPFFDGRASFVTVSSHGNVCFLGQMSLKIIVELFKNVQFHFWLLSPIL